MGLFAMVSSLFSSPARETEVAPLLSELTANNQPAQVKKGSWADVFASVADQGNRAHTANCRCAECNARTVDVEPDASATTSVTSILAGYCGKGTFCTCSICVAAREQ